MRNMIGKRFGMLKVLSQAPKMPGNHNGPMWNCKCDCGNEHIVSEYRLIHNKCDSCGCLKNKKIAKKLTKHGLRYERIYFIWCSIKHRCDVEKDKRYENYGGRGIKYCDSWKEFINFKNDMYGSYLDHAEKFGEKNTTIDRKDVNGNYEPSNCRWSTIKEQENNRSNNNYIIFSGKKMTITEVAESIGINPKTLETRIVRGWSIERALSQPIQKNNSKGRPKK